MGEIESKKLLVPAWGDLIDATRTIVDNAREKIKQYGSPEPDELKNQTVTLRTLTSFYEISENTSLHRLLVLRVELDDHGNPRGEPRTEEFPTDTITERTLLHFGLREPIEPDLVKSLTTIGNELADAKKLDPKIFNDTLVIAYKAPLASPQMSAPFRALFDIGKRTARRTAHKLNPLGV